MKKILPVFVVLLVAFAATTLFITKSGSGHAKAIKSANTTNISNSPTGTAGSYSKNNVALHNSKSDCWTIVNNNVYNITSYVPMHPGGVAQIVRACGVDSTNLFNSIMQHGRRADTELANLKIGTLN